MRGRTIVKRRGRPVAAPRSRLARFLRGGEGVAAIEFAMMVPFLAVALLGTIEVGRLMLLHQKISRVTTQVSDLVSQVETVTEEDIVQVFMAAENSMSPFNIGDQGLIFVSSVSTGTNASDPRINWQREGGGTYSTYSETGNVGGSADLPYGFTMLANRNVIVAEFFYRYEPFFFETPIIKTFQPTDIRRFSVHRPRLGALNTISAGGGGT